MDGRLETLERTRWNKRKAASILGVYRPTLYSKLKKYKLTDRINSQERPRQSEAATGAGKFSGAVTAESEIFGPRVFRDR